MIQRNLAQDDLWPTVQPLPGALKLVQHLHKHKIPIAIATSSTRRNFLLKSAHLGELFGYFDGRVICSDDPREEKLRGKPQPDIFLAAARDLLSRPVGSPKESCNEAEMAERKKGLIFEDALPGLEAGKRAGMSGKPLRLSMAVTSHYQVYQLFGYLIPTYWL